MSQETQLPDWNEVEELLFETSKEAIKEFNQEHPDEVCSFFAYDVDVPYDTFRISFETITNSLRVAKEEAFETIELRKKSLNKHQIWRTAYRYLDQKSVTAYSPDVGYFLYHNYKIAKLDNWDIYYDNDSLPQNKQYEDDYLGGNIKIVLWKVIENLVESGDFELLNLASPFFVGYQFHSDALVTLRILNWPEPK
jgi:hypothetical protein